MSRRSSTAQLKQASEPKYLKEITVIDPTSRYGKLYVPVHLTYDTKGRTEWFTCQGQLPKDLSICCLFQKGKCHVGERCFQVHIDRAWVADSRRKYADLITCCHGCGDVHSNSDSHRRAISKHFPTGIAVISFGGGSDVELEVEASRLANTDGLVDTFRQRVAKRRDGAPILGFNKVCRLHLKNNCKYGKDCKNLHVCHKVANKLNVNVDLIPHYNSAPDHGHAFNSRHNNNSVPLIQSSFSNVDQSRASSVESLCATPEVQSRTSTPNMSPMDVCVIAAAQATAADGASDYVNGIAVSPYSSDLPQKSCDQEMLKRFQAQWTPVPNESLQIIFGGFPPVSL